MEAKFYRFGKPVNSTRIPTEESLRGYGNITLKEKTSVNSPILVMENLEYVRATNMVWLGELNRYYFIQDMVIAANGLLEIVCECDVLASFKSNILNSSQFVIRSASQNDPRVSENMYPISPICEWEQVVASAVHDDGCYIVGVLGRGSVYGTGAISYYALTSSAMQALASWMFTQANYEKEITDEVVKTFFNPSQYVVSSMFCPVNLADSANFNIRLGWFDTDVKGKLISGAEHFPDVTLRIPWPVNSGHYSGYSPYSSYRLLIPQYGVLDINPQIISGAENLVIKRTLDVPTGRIYSTVRTNGGALVSEIEYQSCCNMPLAQSRLDNSLNAKVGMGTAALGESISGFSESLGDSLSSIGNALMASTSQVSSSGGGGGFASIESTYQYVLIRLSKVLSGEANNRFGRPLCKYKKLSDLSGYTQCKNVAFASERGYGIEVEKVVRYMEGGFFIE